MQANGASQATLNSKEAFLARKSIAVVGVSRTKGFGNTAFKELRTKGYQVYAVGHGAAVEGRERFISGAKPPR